jgi:hypothetical protein
MTQNIVNKIFFTSCSTLESNVFFLAMMIYYELF